MPDPKDLRRLFQDYEARSKGASAHANAAYARLLEQAETIESGQAARVAAILAALYDPGRYRIDLRELRALDVAIADDVLACIDAMRWGAELHALVPEGERRVLAVIERWKIPPSAYDPT